MRKRELAEKIILKIESLGYSFDDAIHNSIKARVREDLYSHIRNKIEGVYQMSMTTENQMQHFMDNRKIK